jgi:hypothetical protein
MGQSGGSSKARCCLQAPSEDLVCELVALEDNSAVKECLWPAPFEQASFDFTVIPFMQGMLLPKKWPERVWLYDTISYGRGLYMPWWGYQKGDSAAMVILETPADGGCHFSHPAGGPTRVGSRWAHSLGKLSYPRQARLCFFRKGNYVTLAKRYRRYVIENGSFVSLNEKIARNPIVKRLIGSPVIHTNILIHIQPESSYYNKKDSEKNHYFVRFDKRAEQLRALEKRGVNQAYIHLDVFAVVPPDECYNPEHPVTRKQCLEYRGDCFDFIRTQVGVVSSEEPADWAIPYLDLVHHAPFALNPNPGRGPAMGIPVPLFSLVYHDSIFIPWSLGKGVWGIPENDSGYLHGLAHAGLPYLSIEPAETELQRVRIMSNLNKRLALVEMTNHKFLDDNYRKQQTMFADGTIVLIDLDKDTYTIVPEL